MNKIYIFDLDDTLVIHQNHTVVYENMKYDETLEKLLKGLGKDNKYIYTNGTDGHAKICLENIGLESCFKRTFARDTLPVMKPYVTSFYHVQRQIKFNNIKNMNKEIVFFDDNYENIQVAKMIGWTTVWIHPDFTQRKKYMDHSFPNIYHALLYFSIPEKIILIK